MGIITYKCPNCGGGLTFNAGKQKFRCEFCLSEFTQEELDEIEKRELKKTEGKTEPQEDTVKKSGVNGKITGKVVGMHTVKKPQPVEGEQAAEGPQAVHKTRTAAAAAGTFGSAGQKAAAPESTKQKAAVSESTGREMTDTTGSTGKKKTVTPIMYNCPSCGAQIVTDDTTAASFCYYCHNPIVLEERLRGDFKPDYVIPFQIDKKKAQEIFTQWISKKKYVPDYFYSPSQIESMTGVYFPYWLYSRQVKGDLQAEGKTVRVWDMGGLRYTETKVYDISRQGDMDVNSVARNALKKANRKLIDGVLPYRLNEKKDFSMGYLSGFMAENRDMEKDSFVKEVKDEVRQFALSNLKNQVSNYTSLQIRKNEAELTGEVWANALLPVWTVTYNDKARGKIYYFALNGQTGKIWGELPVDNKKLAVLFLSIFIPVFIILLFIGYWI